MTDLQCPRCGGHEIRGGKQDMRGDTLYDFRCATCGLYESRLRSEPDFVAWRQRWSTPGTARHTLRELHAGRTSEATLFRELARSSARFPSQRVGATWQAAALDITGRPELWLFVDDAAVAACQSEVGAARLGTIGPSTGVAPVLAELPAAVSVVWIDPFDMEAGLVVEGRALVDLRACARWSVVASAVATRGAEALLAADDLQVVALDGSLATESAADGERLVVLGAPTAAEAYARLVAPGTHMHLVHFPGSELPQRVREARVTRNTIASVIVDPAGPSVLGPFPLPPGW